MQTSALQVRNNQIIKKILKLMFAISQHLWGGGFQTRQHFQNGKHMNICVANSH